MDIDTEAVQRAGRPRMVDDSTIFEAALEAFSRHGFDAVSLRDLNRALGVSHAMLTRRFASKEALWRATVDYAFARHRQALDLTLVAPTGAPSDDLAALTAFVAMFVRTAADHPQLQRLINLECCAESDRVDYLFDRCISPLLALVVRPLLDRLADAGVVGRVDDREVFFLVANGAASAFAAAPLSRRFEGRDGVLDPDRYADRVARFLVAGLIAVRDA